MKIGYKLTELREKYGFSREQLAERLQVSCETVSKWENDECAIDVDTATKICRDFDVDLNFFFDEVKEVGPVELQQSNVVASEPFETTKSDDANSNRGTLKIWRTSLVISVVLFSLFFALTIIASCLLKGNLNSPMTTSGFFAVAGLSFAAIASFMAFVMLIISCVMYARYKKSHDYNKK